MPSKVLQRRHDAINREAILVIKGSRDSQGRRSMQAAMRALPRASASSLASLPSAASSRGFHASANVQEKHRDRPSRSFFTPRWRYWNNLENLVNNGYASDLRLRCALSPLSAFLVPFHMHQYYNIIIWHFYVCLLAARKALGPLRGLDVDVPLSSPSHSPNPVPLPLPSSSSSLVTIYAFYSK